MHKYFKRRKRAMNINNQKEVREIHKNLEEILCEKKLKSLIEKEKKTNFKN